MESNIGLPNDKYIIVPGMKGKDRPRFNIRSGKIYTPSTTTQFERIVAQCYKAQGGNCFDDQPVMLSIVLFYKLPQSLSRKRKDAMLEKKQPPMVKPDIDNVVKLVMDALNGVAYDDDKQVVRQYAEKRYTDGEPYIAVRVSPYPTTQAQGTAT